MATKRKKSDPAICSQCGTPLDPDTQRSKCDECIRRNDRERNRMYSARMRAARKAGNAQLPAVTEEWHVVACKNCTHYKHIYTNTWGCCYCMDTGHLRKIDPALCYRHTGTPYTPVLRPGRRKNEIAKQERKA